MAADWRYEEPEVKSLSQMIQEEKQRDDPGNIRRMNLPTWEEMQKERGDRDNLERSR